MEPMEEAIYYIHENGVQRGPFPLSWLAAEGLTPQTMVWRPGLASWVQAGTLPETAVIFQGPDAYGRQPYYGEPKYSQPPYYGQPNFGQPNPYYGGPQPGYLPAGWTNWMPWAIGATVVAVVICGLLNTVFGIIGIVKANSANDAARRGDPVALQLNNSAKTWTIVSFALSALGLILGTLLFLIN